MVVFSNFESIRPPYETLQQHSLDWFAEAHTAAEAKGMQIASDHPDMDAFRQAIREKIWHVGCKPDAIAKRGHILPDYLHCDWEEMQIFRLNESPIGSNLGKRTKIYETYADAVFDKFYVEEKEPPDNLIHVTCTGYVSPSGAQKLVSNRNWGEKTTVTHAYHMGCYGAVPAVRLARGFLATGSERTDIVHTEICSLHANPSLHSSDQLVSQSLFADGFIKYSAQAEGRGMRLHAVHEELIPGSVGAMIWKVVNWGFEMFLAKEIPVLIARSLDNYLIHLCQKAKLLPEKMMSEALFAVHPGGPKIVQHVRKILQLRDEQLEHSQAILRNFGNMSSATLPHIWQLMLADDRIPDGTPIISLAFGPGLTICGTVMEKCGG